MSRLFPKWCRAARRPRRLLQLRRAAPAGAGRGGPRPVRDHPPVRRRKRSRGARARPHRAEEARPVRARRPANLAVACHVRRRLCQDARRVQARGRPDGTTPPRAWGMALILRGMHCRACRERLRVRAQARSPQAIMVRRGRRQAHLGRRGRCRRDGRPSPVSPRPRWSRRRASRRPRSTTPSAGSRRLAP